MPSFDRSYFEAFRAEQKKSDYHHWASKTPAQRLQAAKYLNSIAFGLDNEKKMDKSFFEARKRLG